MRRRSKGLAAVALLLTSTAYAADFEQTYFFGDSLTDSGTYIIQQSPLETGRFTVDPGHVWSEDLASHYGANAAPYGLFLPDSDNDSGEHMVVKKGGSNYAQGGARVDERPGVGILNAMPISKQVDTYLNEQGQADSNALYSVWGGANDVFYQAAEVVSSGMPLEEAKKNLNEAAKADVHQITRLHEAGARYILVPNLPDMGATPASLMVGIQIVGTFAGADDATIEQATAAAIQLIKGRRCGRGNACCSNSVAGIV